MRISVTFREALESFIDALQKSFYSDQGDSECEGEVKRCRKEVIDLFRKVPADDKVLHLYFVITTMSEPTDNGRINNWRREVALKFAQSLEKIEGVVLQ